MGQLNCSAVTPRVPLSELLPIPENVGYVPRDARGHGVDAIGPSRRDRNLEKRPGVALAISHLLAWLAGTGGAWSGTVKTGSLLVILEGDLQWHRDLPGEDI
jgi:hypothetical protein